LVQICQKERQRRGQQDEPGQYAQPPPGRPRVQELAQELREEHHSHEEQPSLFSVIPPVPAVIAPYAQ
jgi:hypothetical protein